MDNMTESVQVKANREYRTIAHVLSWVFHPFVVVVPTMIFSIYATTADLLRALSWTAVCVAYVIVPAILFIRWKLRRKEYTDADVSVRRHRFSIYAFMGVCELLCLATLIIFGAPTILIASFIAAILTLGVATLFNTQTKVSIHTAAMGGCTTVLFYISPILGVSFGLASLAVAWARIYLGHHTLLQVVLGWLIAVVSVILVFTLYPARF